MVAVHPIETTPSESPTEDVGGRGVLRHGESTVSTWDLRDVVEPGLSLQSDKVSIIIRDESIGTVMKLRPELSVQPSLEDDLPPWPRLVWRILCALFVCLSLTALTLGIPVSGLSGSMTVADLPFFLGYTPLICMTAAMYQLGTFHVFFPDVSMRCWTFWVPAITYTVLATAMIPVIPIVWRMPFGSFPGAVLFGPCCFLALMNFSAEQRSDPGFRIRFR
eukprot:TRINITY_DN10902_c0_g1_i1.p2 TRINITY_DN10902_c0_g1~~TRINITY_DN10902_c0_g1_i1.p2  ORF type:complete len:220 (-),score=41.57 TRINITY_DN10902_c0_g1_i1:346-1005(-)